jgi:hypothetical protein
MNTRTASAKTLKPGAPVKALRAAPHFALWPATVVSVELPPSWDRSTSPRVVVEFSDGGQQTYSGAGIRDYLLEVAA